MITVGRLPTKFFVSHSRLYTRVTIKYETNIIFICDVFTQLCQKPWHHHFHLVMCPLRGSHDICHTNVCRQLVWLAYNTWKPFYIDQKFKTLWNWRCLRLTVFPIIKLSCSIWKYDPGEWFCMCVSHDEIFAYDSFQSLYSIAMAFCFTNQAFLYDTL